MARNMEPPYVGCYRFEKGSNDPRPPTGLAVTTAAFMAEISPANRIN
jgi:hypothetical protein